MTVDRASISVVCPTWRSASFIQHTLQSLLELDPYPDEIIFSDDGSDDETIKIIEDWIEHFSEKGVDVQILKNGHLGPGAARNAGIAAARSEWIAFLDSDDFWVSNKIGRIQEIIKTHPNINLVEHWEKIEKRNGEKQILENGSSIDTSRGLQKELYRLCHFSTSATTVRKDLLDKVGGFDRTLPSAQDYELWLRISPWLKPVIVEEVLGCYMEREGNITSRPYYKRYMPMVRILIRHWRKGGGVMAIYRLMRITLTPQWLKLV